VSAPHFFDFFKKIFMSRVTSVVCHMSI